MEDKKLGFWSLVALVIGSMIGGGIFSLPADMAGGASAGAIIIGWVITGTGMICLAFVYQNLANRRPDLSGGIYSYAKEGFGDYRGFNSAWGYWMSAWLGNVSYVVMLFGALGYFFPVFGTGNTLAAIIGASIFIWLINALILKGIKEAAIVNIVTTIAKLVPLFIFVAIVIIAFKADTISLDFWGKGNTDLGSVVKQVKSTMLVTLWVFIGIEGAVVLSGRAKKSSDVGKATVVGLIGTLILYIIISVLSLGVVSQPEMVKLGTPSTAYILERVVGRWGAILINLGLVVSLLGATLGWTLLAAEIPYVAAKDEVLPKFFAEENKNGSPKNSLLVTNLCVQVFLIISYFSAGTYQALYIMASTAILIPYLFSALYGTKITLTGYTYDKNPKGRGKDKAIAIIASIYAIWLIYAAGIANLLMTSIFYVAGVFVYLKAKKEHGKGGLTSKEKITATLIAIAAIIAIVMIITGKISPL